MEAEKIHRAIVLNFQEFIRKAKDKKSVDDFYSDKGLYQEMIVLRDLLIREKNNSEGEFDENFENALNLLKTIVMDKEKREIFMRVTEVVNQLEINLNSLRELQVV